MISLTGNPSVLATDANSMTSFPQLAPPWQSTLSSINRRAVQRLVPRAEIAPVKWSGVTHVLPNQPTTWGDLQTMIIPHDRDPQPHDVLVGRVVEFGRHGAVELRCGRKAELHLGDLLVGAFGNRYATAQYEGCVPGRQDYYHMLSQGGVFGQVQSATSNMSDPTIIEPVGYLRGHDGAPLNLTAFGLPNIEAPRVPTLLVLGSSMDAGKTTTAASLVHGLSLAGWRVHAGKLTGTGCAKDINKMRDAGAHHVLDFTSCGHVSTADASAAELLTVSTRLISHLSVDQPDILVLEIADGIVQRETTLLATMLAESGLVDGALLAIHDVLSVETSLQIIEQRFGTPVLGVSGVVSKSQLSMRELSKLTTLPIFDIPALVDPDIEEYVNQFLCRHNHAWKSASRSMIEPSVA